MTDRWGLLPMDEPRCELCRSPLKDTELPYNRCDACALRLVRAMFAVDKAVQGYRRAS